MVALNIHRPFVAAESIVWIFFIFWCSQIRISPTNVVSSLSPPRCRLSFGQHHHVATPYHAYFPWSQDEFTASTSSFGNASSHRLPSQVEIEALNSHHRRRPPSLDRPTPTLHCYKNVISTLATLSITQPRLHFASSLTKAQHHRSFTRRRRSLSSSSYAHGNELVEPLSLLK
jgi:hypothetical protein